MAASGKSAARRPGRRGLVGAYVLVLALIAGAAGLAFGDFKGKTPEIIDKATAAEPSPTPDVVQSLPLPVRPPPSGFRSLPPAELAEMIETTSDGARLPRISSTGWMPWIVNSRRFDTAGPPARIGLLVINLGVDEGAMRRAIEDLPAEVSLAFLPGTPDLPRWLGRAREFGHESYLMLPIDDSGTAERGIRPIEGAAEAAENLRRLRVVLSRGEGYVGLVISSPAAIAQADDVMRPLVKELSERGLAVVEVNQAPGAAAVQRLTEELGTGYARSADVLDYKLAGDGVAGNLDRLTAWVAETAPGRAPRHAFGVIQPGDEAIGAVLGWHRRREDRSTVSLVPLIGHFECRDACMSRMRAQPAQLRP